MRILNVALLIFLLVQDTDDRCEHGTRGSAAAIRIERIEKSYLDFAVRVSEWSGSLDPKLALDEPWDSGLPACKSRQTRHVKRAIPPGMVGKTLVFGPEGDFVTKVKRRRDLFGKLMATPDVTVRFDVRCVPTTVQVKKDELELLENP